MIIKEVNIGKFGKLENQKYQFAPRINVIYGANESGKSTLMQFLKAMLFGLEKTRVRKTLDTYNRLSFVFLLDLFDLRLHYSRHF